MAAAGVGKPSLPLTVRLYVAGLLASVDICSRRNGTVNRRLINLIDVKAKPKTQPVAGVRSADVTIDAELPLWARVFVPTAATAAADEGGLPVVFYFHGGGFSFFSASSLYYDRFCRRICRELPAVVVSVNYRLAPEHKYPAAYDDGVRALDFIDGGGLSQLPILDGAPAIDLSRCFLAGDSAGGNIVHHVARRWLQTVGGGERKLKLAGLVLIQAYFGGAEKTPAELKGLPVVTPPRVDFTWKAFLPPGANRTHPAAYVFGDGDALEEDFPPAMVVVGGFDPLQDWQRRYVEMLKQSEKAARLSFFPEAIHGFYIFPELPDSGKMIMEMKDFVSTRA